MTNRPDPYGSIALVRGLIPGWACYEKFGRNPSIDTTSDPEDIWDQGGVYTFLSSAASLYVSSSDNSDTNVITVEGLDANWVAQTATVTLTGQTQAEITGVTWIRVFRAYSATDTAGDVYIAETDTLTAGVPDTASKIKAKFEIARQQTEMSIYTVPAGKTGYVYQWSGSILKSSAATSVDLVIMKREFGGSLRDVMPWGLSTTGTSSFAYAWGSPECPQPKVMPAKTDILIRANEVGANGTQVTAGFDIKLRDD